MPHSVIILFAVYLLSVCYSVYVVQYKIVRFVFLQTVLGDLNQQGYESDLTRFLL